MQARSLVLLFLASLALFALLPCTGVAADNAMLYLHNGPEAPGDKRYAYHWRVLEAALAATSDKWGPYQMRPAAYMTEARQVVEMQNPKGAINTMVLDTTVELENKLLPVKIPVDKGLLGYRVLLIRAAEQSRFDRVKTFDDLKRFSFGLGANWSDVSIFRQAGLTVVTGNSYQGLFHMLAKERYDAFSRGVTEVLGEMAEYGKDHPEIVIESKLLIYYPMPVYFWFPRHGDGPRRAKRVEEGMQAIIANGTLERLFRAEFDPVLNKLGVRQRQLFTLANPLLPPGQAFDDKKLWFDPRR